MSVTSSKRWRFVSGSKARFSIFSNPSFLRRSAADPEAAAPAAAYISPPCTRMEAREEGGRRDTERLWWRVQSAQGVEREGYIGARGRGIIITCTRKRSRWLS